MLSFAWCDVIKMKKSYQFFHLPKSISLSTISRYLSCSTVAALLSPKICQNMHNSYAKSLSLPKSFEVYFQQIVFQSWWPDIAFGLYKSDTEIGYVECLLTNIWGVSSLFKRKNICKTFSKPFILGTLRAFTKAHALWFTKPWLFVLLWSEMTGKDSWTWF